jgi:hypothetical protein
MVAAPATTTLRTRAASVSHDAKSGDQPTPAIFQSNENNFCGVWLDVKILSMLIHEDKKITKFGNPYQRGPLCV